MNKIVTLFLASSLALNAGLGWFVFKKGVTITQTYNIQNHQHQNQQQSMAVFSDTKEIKNIVWKFMSYYDMAKVANISMNEADWVGRSVQFYANTLTPWQIYICKPLPTGILFGYTEGETK